MMFLCAGLVGLSLPENMMAELSIVPYVMSQNGSPRSDLYLGLRIVLKPFMVHLMIKECICRVSTKVSLAMKH